MGKRKKNKRKRTQTVNGGESFNDSFVDISALAADNSRNSSFNSVTYTGCEASIDETNKCESLLNSKTTLHGISSFQGFIMSTSNSTSTGNITVKENSTENVVKKETVSNSLPEDISRSVSFPSCPIILKRKDPRLPLLSTSPIKSLTFSPSRFLNAKSETKDFDIDSDVSRDLSFTNSTFDVEDSGIGSSDVDASVPLSPPSLTSTPCTRSRRKASLRSLANLLSSPEQNDSCNTSVPLQSTPKTSDGTDSTKTPIIRKFLIESAPRTPTPFKCPINPVDKENPVSKDNDSTNLHLNNDEFCFKRPSPVTSRRRWKDSFKRTSTGKTARKALVLDQDQNYYIKRSLFKRENVSSDKFKTDKNVTCLNTFDQSGLIENTAIVEKRKYLSCGKSKYFTRRAGTSEQSKGLDKKWVSIACGRSVDQKVMTEAAKRYLRQRCNSS